MEEVVHGMWCWEDGWRRWWIGGGGGWAEVVEKVVEEVL